METPPVETRRATTEPIFEFLSDVPWWIVIIAIVGVFVSISVFANPFYRVHGLNKYPWKGRNIIECGL